MEGRAILNSLVLSLFPGVGLMDRGFEAEGFCVVRGPDLLWGGDIRSFHVPNGKFDGIIGGPPCQWASQMKGLHKSEKAIDYTPDFIRIVEEAKPKWVVMENVRLARRSGSIPNEWFPLKVRDYDVGGLTARIRYFWIYPATLTFDIEKRSGKPARSVNTRGTSIPHSCLKNSSKFIDLSLNEMLERQGFPEMKDQLKIFKTREAKEVVGNGLPKAMGQYIARVIKGAFYGQL